MDRKNYDCWLLGSDAGGQELVEAAARECAAQMRITRIDNPAATPLPPRDLSALFLIWDLRRGDEAQEAGFDQLSTSPHLQGVPMLGLVNELVDRNLQSFCHRLDGLAENAIDPGLQALIDCLNRHLQPPGD